MPPLEKDSRSIYKKAYYFTYMLVTAILPP